MMDEFDYRYELLTNEIENLQKRIDRFDNISIVIKGWAITLALPLIIFSIVQQKPELLIIDIMLILLFWILDAMNKSIQRMFIVRHIKIEYFLRSKDFSDAIRDRSFKDFKIPDTLGQYSVKDWKDKITIKKAFFYHYTSGLYVVMIIMAISIYFLMIMKKIN